MQFIFGPLVILMGILMMKYTVDVTNFTGKIDWAERYLRGGLYAGTFTLWRIVGLVFVILGALYLTGLTGIIGDALVSILGIRHPYQ